MIPPLDASPEITELERLAKAATPGPWKMIAALQAEYKCVAFSRKRDENYTTSPLLPPDAAFIAAANPSTILKLLALLRRLGEREARTLSVVDAARRWQSARQTVVTASLDGGSLPAGYITVLAATECNLRDAVAALAAGKEGE